MIRRPPRRPEIERRIAAGDVAWLRAQVEYNCACMGAVDDEPKCSCEMTSIEVRRMVSYAALRRGRIVRLKDSD